MAFNFNYFTRDVQLWISFISFIICFDESFSINDDKCVTLYAIFFERAIFFMQSQLVNVHAFLLRKQSRERSSSP